MKSLPVHSFQYSLRRTLVPWRFEELLQDLIRQCHNGKIDEVILKVDSEEFSHGHPTPQWVLEYCKKLEIASAALKKAGIRYSLNPWLTLGHCDRGRNDRNRKDFSFLVGTDGTECRHCACPLSKGWMENLLTCWRAYAGTHPEVIWVEDDIRTYNHEPVQFGCFCELHLDRFSGIIGKKVSREEVVSAILAPGKPHPWRKRYLEMQREIMIEIAGKIAKAVHEISPETCLGLMSSGPRGHVLEGRDWERFAEALADGQPLYSRPPMGNYREYSFRDLYFSQDSVKLTRHVLPAETRERTEIESWPFTQFSKSVRFTSLQLFLTAVCGAEGASMNLYDHMGSLMSEDPTLIPMLKKVKPALNALRGIAREKGVFRGVSLPFHQDYSITKELPPRSGYGALGGDGYPMALALEKCGIATTYDPSETIAASGQLLRNFSEDEILNMLKKGVLLDAVAAKNLLDRGFGDLIGLKDISVPKSRPEIPEVLSAEWLEHPDFGGAPDRFLSATLSFEEKTPLYAIMKLLPNAAAVSSWVNYDRKKVMPAMSIFTNRLGGRIAVHSLDYEQAAACDVFYHPRRREQLQSVVRFLSGGQPDCLLVCDGSYGWGCRRDFSSDTLLSAFNFTLDPFTECRFELAWKEKSPAVERLDSSGKWIPCRNCECSLERSVLKIFCRQKTDHRFPLILRLLRPVPF